MFHGQWNYHNRMRALPLNLKTSKYLTPSTVPILQYPHLLDIICTWHDILNME